MFTTPLKIQKVNQKWTLKAGAIWEDRDHYWVLTSDLIWDDGKNRFVIKSGFKTDLATIPKTLQAQWKPDGAWARAAVLHDWLYEQPRIAGTRVNADNLFLKAMCADKVPLGTALWFYGNVRVMGEAWWGKNFLGNKF